MYGRQAGRQTMNVEVKTLKKLVHLADNVPMHVADLPRLAYIVFHRLTLSMLLFYFRGDCPPLICRSAQVQEHCLLLSVAEKGIVMTQNMPRFWLPHEMCEDPSCVMTFNDVGSWLCYCSTKQNNIRRDI